MNQQKLELGKNTLVVSIMTLLTVFTWIAFEVYHAYTQPTIPKIMRELITPLDPTLNRTIIEDIKEKYQLSDEELNVITAPPLEIETEEEITPSPTASPSGSLEE